MTVAAGSWELGIAVNSRGDVAGASRVEEERPWRVDGHSVAAIVAEAARKHGRSRPRSVTVVHPRWMGSGELAGVHATLAEKGVSAVDIRTVSDARVLADAARASRDGLHRDARHRDGLGPAASAATVYVDAVAGRVYGETGWASPEGADVGEEVAARIRDHGAFATEVVLVGPNRDTRAMAERLAGVIAGPARYSMLDLACGGLMPESIRIPRGGEAGSRATAASARRSGRASRRLGQLVALALVAAASFVGWRFYGGHVFIPHEVRNTDGSTGWSVSIHDGDTLAPERPTPPATASAQDKFAHYFRAFDARPLLDALGDCRDDGATLPGRATPIASAAAPT